jgi:hypothetical protein
LSFLAGTLKTKGERRKEKGERRKEKGLHSRLSLLDLFHIGFLI